MTVSPAASPARRDAFAVTPVVEYEPASQSVPRNVAPCRPASRPTPRRAGPVPRPEATPVLSPSMRQAATFADAALRRVLEVIDRRRPPAQLRPLLAPGLVDTVLSVGRAPAGRAGAAVLRRTRLQPAGHPATAAEVFGCYSRGDRVHAIACRVERTAGARWLVVALHIG
ncbi:Rv3235 family protein [Mycobacterium sp. 663a-19]|uniref:Rv3235 family protein n=1 Tax=Mycobacterium sp. 663a-19 TaxID=2986148 RepID=UPI002D1E590A|nr:Rv3235 family protein [Mycobacterium sp. 663a-19]MEB3982227.1 Rv3235 family protein [Mycobacterium sp. 663a-19]